MVSTKKDRFCYRTSSLSPSTKISIRSIYCLKAIESAKNVDNFNTPFRVFRNSKKFEIIAKVKCTMLNPTETLITKGYFISGMLKQLQSKNIT